jgi:hypothetical protein
MLPKLLKIYFMRLSVMALSVDLYPELERRENLSAEEFVQHYRGKKIVVFTPYNHAKWSQEVWNKEELKRTAGDVQIRVRPAMDDYQGYEGASERMCLNDYFDYIDQWHEDNPSSDLIPPYAQDNPLLKQSKKIREKFTYFPFDYFPKWYHKVWEDYPCFFIGSSKSVTPLHYDNCETHNMFFQVHGEKKFFLVHDRDSQYCYRVGWRRSQVDAKNLDEAKFPDFKKADVREVVVKAGEMLYMPPRTWHQAYADEFNISFNLDWHTKQSAVRGVCSVFRGMPPSIAFFYNLPHAVGLLTGLPLRKIIRRFQGFVLM